MSWTDAVRRTSPRGWVTLVAIATGSSFAVTGDVMTGLVVFLAGAVVATVATVAGRWSDERR